MVNRGCELDIQEVIALSPMVGPNIHGVSCAYGFENRPLSGILLQPRAERATTWPRGQGGRLGQVLAQARRNGSESWIYRQGTSQIRAAGSRVSTGTLGGME